MKVTFIVDLYMTGNKGYEAFEMDIPVLPRKTEHVTIDEKFVNYIVAEIFHQIINKVQKVSILLVPTIESDKTDTDINKN